MNEGKTYIWVKMSQIGKKSFTQVEDALAIKVVKDILIVPSHQTKYVDEWDWAVYKIFHGTNHLTVSSNSSVNSEFTYTSQER